MLPQLDPLASFLAQLAAAGAPEPVRELRFAAPRRWRFDLAYPAADGQPGVAVEVEGGIWQHGRHQRPQGFAADIGKYNAATLRGWLLLRVTYDMIDDGTACAVVVEGLHRRGLLSQALG